MATRITNVGEVPYRSSGVYFREIDLTVVTAATGGFSAASVGLMEKGPAFEILNSSTYEDRAFRAGELNPDYPTSYYAKQYLEQARNYKEVRILGLEGYKDTLGFAITGMYGSTAADPIASPPVQLQIGESQLLCLLKQRPTFVTGNAAITSVEVQKAQGIDPNSGGQYDRASDYLFKLVITYDQSNGNVDPTEIVASLRPESKDYIVRKFGTNPLELPKLGNIIAPLWVDMIIPSVKSRPFNYANNTFLPSGYYIPGTNTPVSGFVDLTLGETLFSTVTTVNNVNVLDVTFNSTQTKIKVAGNITSWLSNNDGVQLSGIVDKNSLGNLSNVLNNQQFIVKNILFTGGNTEFTINDLESDTPITDLSFMPGSELQLPGTVKNVTQTGTAIEIQNIVFTSSASTVSISGDQTLLFTVNDDILLENVIGTNIANINALYTVTSIAYSSGTGMTTFNLLINGTANNAIFLNGQFQKVKPNASKFIIPTWEAEILDYEGVIYKTPTTPWFVTDIDSSGHYKRLFRFYSISDGESANSEIKIEIRNINQSGANGNGTFDIVLRKWDDRDDLSQVRYESFSNLTMDSESDNFILKRIGNGEDFPIRSRFMFVEMNTDESLEPDELPWGILGYPNTTGNKIQDIPWTVDYDKTKPINKQTLGIANNKTNMNKEVTPDMFAYKNSNGQVGKGFHLNPTGILVGATGELVGSQYTPANNNFVFCTNSIYRDITGKMILPLEKVNRNKFAVSFAGGFDGWNIYKERQWNDVTSKDYEALQMAVDVLSDKETLDSDFSVLVTPDMNIQDHGAGCELVLEMINNRGDALYLPDFKYDIEADTFTVVDALSSSNMRSNNVAMYFPHLQISDTINKVNKWLPASLMALGTIAYVATNEQVWQPPGGSIRTVTDNLVRSRRRLKLDDREQLIDVNINPITSFPGSGYEIAGVRTTQEQFSALSFIHNRLLLCYAKKVLNQVLRPLLFQNNNTMTQDAFIATVTPIFDRIKKLNGVEEYKVEIVERPELNDKTTIYGRIVIVPLYPVERIVVDFVLNDGDVNFNQ